jgi:spermidine synthase
MWIYVATVFAGAWLLFQVQPLISRFILPWFGGSTSVWTTCMLFFQTLLVAGYAYAHLIVRTLSPKRQAIVQVAVLAAAAAILPVIPDAAWKPDSSDDPTLRIFLLLAAVVGLPYFTLATTGPLLQAWFARRFPGVSPYPLYALSNLGSLLGLVSYPFVIEPALALRTQAWAWSGGFAVYALGCAWCAWHARRRAQASAPDEPTAAPAPPAPAPSALLAWAVMAACPSMLLLATTNQICQDVAVVPFLWVLPLALYLISFILCFASSAWYARQVAWPLTALALAGVAVVLDESHSVGIRLEILLYSAALFGGSMICHGELARSVPHPVHLTVFYLAVSVGGALGGAFVALAAPLLFDLFLELPMALLGVVVIGLAAAFRDRRSPLYGGRPVWAWSGFGVAFFGFAAALGWTSWNASHEYDTIERNFYGIVRTYSGWDDEFGDDYRALVHGRIEHGFQYLSPEHRREQVSYYGPASGIGLAMRHALPPSGRRIGVVGLGVGTLAAFAEPGDEIRFYEINPAVVQLATEDFSYLDDCPAQWDIVLGDARLALERELRETGGRGRGYDLLALDAFAGDALPVHLLTREAFDIYLGHLAHDGVLAINISNRYLDLSPVVWGIAASHGLDAVLIENWEEPEYGIYDAWWMVVTRDGRWAEQGEVKEAIYEVPDNDTRRHDHIRLWTDDYSNLFQLLLQRPLGDSEPAEADQPEGVEE